MVQIFSLGDNIFFLLEIMKDEQHLFIKNEEYFILSYHITQFIFYFFTQIYCIHISFNLAIKQNLINHFLVLEIKGKKKKFICTMSVP